MSYITTVQVRGHCSGVHPYRLGGKPVPSFDHTGAHGDTLEQVLDDVRAMGWSISAKTDKCFCPECKIRLRLNLYAEAV